MRALVARNQMLTILETVREQEHLTKKQLAVMAGLDPSAVRRLLTAKTANPTTENAFRLYGAMNIGLEAVLPDGTRVSIIESPKIKSLRGREPGASGRSTARRNRARPSASKTVAEPA